MIRGLHLGCCQDPGDYLEVKELGLAGLVVTMSSLGEVTNVTLDGEAEDRLRDWLVGRYTALHLIGLRPATGLQTDDNQPVEAS